MIRYIQVDTSESRGEQVGVASLSLCPDTITIHDTELRGEGCAYTYTQYIISAM